MLTITDAARILRAYTGTHIRHVYLNHEGGRCAIGILGGEKLEYGVRRITAQFKGSSMNIATRIGEWYGMSDEIVDDIINMNDDGASLHEIADKLEGRGHDV